MALIIVCVVQSPASDPPLPKRGDRLGVGADRPCFSPGTWDFSFLWVFFPHTSIEGGARLYYFLPHRFPSAELS